MLNVAGKLSSSSRSIRRDRRGFVLISTAVLALGLISFLGLAFDIGYIQWKRRQLQIAADSASLGAVTEIVGGSSSSVATSAAKADATLNGFTDTANGVTVTVNTPPSSGFDTANASAVEVSVAQNAPLYFLRLFGLSTASDQGAFSEQTRTQCRLRIRPESQRIACLGDERGNEHQYVMRRHCQFDRFPPPCI